MRKVLQSTILTKQSKQTLIIELTHLFQNRQYLPPVIIAIIIDYLPNLSETWRQLIDSADPKLLAKVQGEVNIFYSILKEIDEKSIEELAKESPLPTFPSINEEGGPVFYPNPILYPMNALRALIKGTYCTPAGRPPRLECTIRILKLCKEAKKVFKATLSFLGAVEFTFDETDLYVFMKIITEKPGRVEKMDESHPKRIFNMLAGSPAKSVFYYEQKESKHFLHIVGDPKAEQWLLKKLPEYKQDYLNSNKYDKMFLLSKLKIKKSVDSGFIFPLVIYSIIESYLIEDTIDSIFTKAMSLYEDLRTLTLFIKFPNLMNIFDTLFYAYKQQRPFIIYDEILRKEFFYFNLLKAVAHLHQGYFLVSESLDLSGSIKRNTNLSSGFPFFLSITLENFKNCLPHHKIELEAFQASMAVLADTYLQNTIPAEEEKPKDKEFKEMTKEEQTSIETLQLTIRTLLRSSPVFSSASRKTGRQPVNTELRQLAMGSES